MRHYEALILGSVVLATVGLIACGIAIVCARPQFLYMPLYENEQRNPDTAGDDDRGMEMV